MYLNYDLARALLDDHRARARKESQRRRIEPETRPDVDPAGDAEVIELVFGKHCDAGRIGA